MTYAISYRSAPGHPLMFNGLYQLPGLPYWRIVRDAAGRISLFDSPAAAEARAGHSLCDAANEAFDHDEGEDAEATLRERHRLAPLA